MPPKASDSQTPPTVPPPEQTDSGAAAEAASEQAQSQARAEAEQRGITLSEAELDRIGDRAAQSTHQLFEREGAFRHEEAAPPPPPPQTQQQAPTLDEAPTQHAKRKFAHKICDT